MKKRVRFTAALLAIVMLFGLAACGKVRADESGTQPTEAPKMSADEAYAALAQATSEVTAYKTTCEYTLIRNVGGTLFTEKDSAILRVNNEKQKDMTALYDCGRSVTVNGCTTDCGFARSFVGSRAYYDGKDGGRYYQQISPEDYTAMLLPKVILTQENFESVTYAADGSTIELAGGMDFEPWMDGQNAKLTFLDGRVTAAENGTIATAELNAAYTRDGTAYTLALSMSFEPDEQDIEVTADRSEYCITDDIRAPEYLAYARCAFDSQLFAADILTNASSEYDVVSVIRQDSASLYQADDTVEAYLSYENIVFDGEDAEDSCIDKEYHDGVLTVTKDDDEPIEEENDGREFAAELRSLAAQLMPDAGEISKMWAYDAEDCWLIEYEGTESLENEKKEMVKSLCTDEDDNAFELAEGYKNKQTAGFVTIDKDTYLPVAAAQSYTGICTVNGHKYYMSSTEEVSYDFENEDIYYSLTDELLPESEPENRATPLLYEVTAPNGSKMWLMGTIHVGDERTNFLPQELYDALFSSDALAVECDVDAYYERLDDDYGMQQQYYDATFYNDGTLYYEHISDMEVAQVTQSVLKKYGYDMLFGLQPFKVTSVSGHIEGCYQALGRTLSSNKGADMRLLKLAKDNDIQILEVESAEFQMQLLGNFPDIVQTCELAGTVGLTRYESNDNTREMYELWCRGDENELREYLADEEDEETEEMSERVRRSYERYKAAYDQYNEEMVIKRNANMLQAAKQYMNTGKTVFFAVGLAHLLDENGLVDALREAGYTVEQVVYE